MEKSKTGKYFKYALGEITLVVIGILIALQINNWNEHRKMQLQEQEYLKGLKVEFTINRDRLVYVMQTSQQSIENANKLMTYFYQDNSEFQEVKFDSLLYNIQAVWTFNPRKGLLNSIIASGQINLVRNVELKNQLASFEDLVNDSQEELDALSLLNARFNLALDEYINRGRQNIIGYDVFVNDGFKSDYNRFFKDHRVYNLLNNITTWRYDLKGEETEQLQSIDRILVLIKEELDTE
jgi:hypothetical protein